MKLPFTTEQFFEIIEKYNLAVFPSQVIILLLGLICVFLLRSKSGYSNALTGGFLGIAWIWSGIAYHLAFFTDINPAAYAFGALFVIQGILFLVETFVRKNLEFEFRGSTGDYIGYFFILFGLLIYPVLTYFMEGALLTTITLGLPCPTTIVTFGFLMLTTPKFPKYLLIIPAIWTLIGTTAAFNFGVYPDYMMLVAALFAIIYLAGLKNSARRSPR